MLSQPASATWLVGSFGKLKHFVYISTLMADVLKPSRFSLVCRLMKMAAAKLSDVELCNPGIDLLFNNDWAGSEKYMEENK